MTTRTMRGKCAARTSSGAAPSEHGGADCGTPRKVRGYLAVAEVTSVGAHTAHGLGGMFPDRLGKEIGAERQQKRPRAWKKGSRCVTLRAAKGRSGPSPSSVMWWLLAWREEVSSSCKAGWDLFDYVFQK